MVGHSCNAGTHATEWWGRDRVPTMYRLCTLTMHRLCTITSSRSGVGSRPGKLQVLSSLLRYYVPAYMRLRNQATPFVAVPLSAIFPLTTLSPRIAAMQIGPRGKRLTNTSSSVVHQKPAEHKAHANAFIFLRCLVARNFLPLPILARNLHFFLF